MKSIAAKVGTALVILLFLFFGLKGCIVSLWSPPKEIETYAISGADGRSLSIIFFPDRKTIFLYTEQGTGFVETSLTEMRGTYGTHYFGRLWNVSRHASGFWFGLRVYPAGSEPVIMETTVLKKFVHGTSKPSLPATGARTYPVLLFSKDAVQFEGMELRRQPTDHQLIARLRASL